MSKLQKCLMWSVISIVVLGIVALLSGPTKTDGRKYLQVVLRGWGRELKREGDRIYFYRQGHHGWDFYWTTRSEAEAVVRECVKEYVNDWLHQKRRYRRVPRRERPVLFGMWEKRRFEALTGHDFETAKHSPSVWWESGRWDFSPTMVQVRAYLDEWRSQALTRDNIVAAGRSYPDDFGLAERELISDGCLKPARCPFGGHREEAVKRWLRSRRRLWNFTFEAVYFPLLIFYLAYTVPAVSRKLAGRQCRQWVRYAALGAVIHFGLVLPYALGYSPYWLSTRGNQGTILYNVVLTLVELPTVLCIGSLRLISRPTLELIGAICRPLDYLLYPVFWYINQPGTTYRSFSTNASRGGVLLIGTLVYAILGAAYWGFRVRVRTRKSEAEDAEEEDQSAALE